MNTLRHVNVTLSVNKCCLRTTDKRDKSGQIVVELVDQLLADSEQVLNGIDKAFSNGEFVIPKKCLLQSLRPVNLLVFISELSATRT